MNDETNLYLKMGLAVALAFICGLWDGRKDRIYHWSNYPIVFRERHVKSDCPMMGQEVFERWDHNHWVTITEEDGELVR